jgi:hypothetical protein
MVIDASDGTNPGTVRWNSSWWRAGSSTANSTNARVPWRRASRSVAPGTTAFVSRRTNSR